MAQNLLTPGTFFRDLLINFISGLAGGAVVGLFSGKFWIGVMSFLLILTVLFFLWLWGKYHRLFKVILSGCAGYYYSFDLDENPKVWQTARKSFCYLGISCDSIMEAFRRWLDEHPLSSYRILLMRPEAHSLLLQQAFEKGHVLALKPESLSPEAQLAVESAAAATGQRIRGAVSILKNSVAYREGRMKIRFYDEFLPWWMYLIDDRTAYVGILERGKRGSDSPVLVVKKTDEYTSPFEAFKNNFERLWESAIDA